jgi:23S rRNA pseudouridine2605 synthase
MERKDPILHPQTLRLNRFLALAGVGSRRKNDELILSGVVRVNGKVVSDLGVKVDPARDRVSVRGTPVGASEKKVYVLLNKPKDCITTAKDERGRKTVLDCVRADKRVFPVGRLDRHTTGVLLLTNDGDLAHGLMHPSFEIERVYHVRLDEAVSEGELKKLRRGVRLKDGYARLARLSVVPGSRRQELILTIREGRNREVRRLMEAIGKEVKKLDRVAYAGLTTEGVARGKWRYLHPREINALKKLSRRRPAPDGPTERA